MTGPDYSRRLTAHAPMTVRTRSGLHVVHGEPRCGAPKVPGSTVADPEDVDCKKCLALREQAAKGSTHA